MPYDISSYSTVSVPLQVDRINIKIFPDMPGVYIFKDASGMPLYVGKARILRNRLASYFASGASPPRTSIMLKHAKSVEFIVTGTEKEALLLESSLIKGMKPRYNIMMRDDKSYPFLRIDLKEPFPRITITRNRQNKQDKARYFGPYPSANAVRETLRFISSLFPLRTCANNSMKNRDRPCIKHQIGRCRAPCVGLISKEEYMEMAIQVVMFLEGDKRRLTDILEQRMLNASERLEFEKAALYRDQLHAVNTLLEKQAVFSETNADMDVTGLHMESNLCMISLIRIRNGVITGSENIRMDNIDDASKKSIMFSFIKLYYSELITSSAKVDIPSAIYSNWLPDDIKYLEKTVSEIADKRIRICRADRGEKRRLAKMADKNAEQSLAALLNMQETWKSTAEAALQLLGLSKKPEWIEGVDISNTGGRESIGSLVLFKKGKPHREGYRIFNIRETDGPDDYASIYEVVNRRKKKWIKYGTSPDLLLIDGGRGQLAMAENAIADLPPELRPDLASIAKKRANSEEKVYLSGRENPLILPAHDPVLRLLQHVRDEAHRFGLNRHRKKRTKSLITNELCKIKGVGKSRQRALLQHFGSISRIKSASLDEIMMVRGISENVAKNIHECFRNK